MVQFRCSTCHVVFATRKSLALHLHKFHIKTRRCAICYLRFFSLKCLYTHYVRLHSKALITKQLMKLSSRPSTWNTGRKNFIPEQYTLDTAKNRKLCVEENIHISYGNKEIIVELSSDNEESLEISIGDLSGDKNSASSIEKSKSAIKALIYDDDSNCTIEFVKANEKLVIVPTKVKSNRGKKQGNSGNTAKQYKHFWLEFIKRNESKSLDHTTGKFYICNCSKSEDSESEKEDEVIMLTSDTESSSDNGKYSFSPIIDKKLYCSICGNGYKTKNKLMEHCRIHNFQCHPCGTHYPTRRQYNEHLKHHIPIYCCHICNHEFLQKVSLTTHLNVHQDQEMLKNILELEQNYSHYLINFSSESYATSLNNISSFLAQACDFKYSTTEFYKIRCHLCYMDFFKCDFQQHLKMHYYFRNNNSYFSSAEFSCLS